MDKFVDTKAELLEHIVRDWTAINALLDDLTDAQWTDVKNPDGWAVKDHIAHLTAWHRYVIAILTGKPRHEGLGVPAVVYVPKDIDAINTVIFQQHRHEPLDQVRSEFQLTHHTLMRQINQMTDDDLMKPYRDFLPDYPEESEAPIIDTIYGDTAFHYREHQSWIETMLKR
ncbi:MAG: ClbS/DfsB family four-helix bundle protein [Anaerolineae bacterium]